MKTHAKTLACICSCRTLKHLSAVLIDPTFAIVSKRRIIPAPSCCNLYTPSIQKRRALCTVCHEKRPRTPRSFSVRKISWRCPTMQECQRRKDPPTWIALSLKRMLSWWRPLHLVWVSTNRMSGLLHTSICPKVSNPITRRLVVPAAMVCLRQRGWCTGCRMRLPFSKCSTTHRHRRRLFKSNDTNSPPFLACVRQPIVADRHCCVTLVKIWKLRVVIAIPVHRHP